MYMFVSLYIYNLLPVAFAPRGTMAAGMVNSGDIYRLVVDVKSSIFVNSINQMHAPSYSKPKAKKKKKVYAPRLC